MLNAVMVLAAIAQFAVPVMAPAIAADLRVDATWLGIYSTLTWCASLTASIGAGRFIARFGAWRLSQMVLIASALGILAAASGNLALFALSAILVGLGLGVETPASSSILARVTPPERAPFVFSFKQTGLQIGGFATGAALPAIALALGWQTAFVGVALLLAVGAFVLIRPRHTRSLAPAAGASVSFRQAVLLTFADRQLRTLAFVALAFVGTQACIVTFLVTFFVADHGVALVLAGSYLAATQAGGLIGRLFWGSVAGRWIEAHRVLILLGSGMTIVCIALGTVVATLSIPVVYALAFLGGLTSAGWTGIYLAEVARLAPAGEVARFTSASFVISTFGLILTPGAFSLVAAATDYGTAFIAASFLSASGVALLLWSRRRARL